MKGNIDLSKCVNLTNIAQFSFKQALSITGLVLPPNLTTIGAYAFQDDKALTGNLALPKSLKSLGASAFTGCQLTSLVIPDDTHSPPSLARRLKTMLSLDRWSFLVR